MPILVGNTRRAQGYLEVLGHEVLLHLVQDAIAVEIILGKDGVNHSIVLAGLVHAVTKLLQLHFAVLQCAHMMRNGVE